MPILPKFRRARASDAAAIAGLLVRSWQQSYRQFLPAEYLSSLTVEGRLSLVESLIKQPQSETWLVEDDGRLLGFVNTGRSRDPDVDRRTTAELRALYLEPDQVGSGLGAALLLRAMESMVTQGFLEVMLWVLEDNQQGIAFWLRHGFKQDGCRREEQREGAELRQVRFRRPLSQ
ncbi:GNAT family N-acetyltransferase [Gallaecimonas sp. GXIMD4217]|uniref:GNAT family N-acetyltransferase n=1 Tax=Gallaecimonas sp. GXIMD4217 TaxID=3131927 RepID=UPI00311AD09D